MWHFSSNVAKNLLLLLLLLLLPFWYVQTLCGVISTLSHCVRVCVCLCTEVFQCWKQKDVSRSCVRLLACCKSHTIPVSLWECSLVKKEFFWVKVVKRKKLTKNLYLKKRKAEEGGLLLFFHVNIERYIHIIYIVYMLCMLQHLWGIFLYSFCLFNGTVNSLDGSWFFCLCTFIYS